MFRPVDRHGRVQGQRLSGEAVSVLPLGRFEGMAVPEDLEGLGLP